MTDPELLAWVGAGAGVLATGAGTLLRSMFRAWLLERAEDRTDRKAERNADREERREDRAAMVEVVRSATEGMSTIAERLSTLERTVDRSDARVSGLHEIPVQEPEPAPPTPIQRTIPRSGTTPGGGVRVVDRPYDRNRER